MMTLIYPKSKKHRQAIPKMTAYCLSEKCCSYMATVKEKGKYSLRTKTRGKVTKDVELKTVFCPDCNHALTWRLV